MERPSEILTEDKEIGLTAQEMVFIIKALDVYAHALFVSDNVYELHAVQRLVNKFIEKAPKPELDS